MVGPRCWKLNRQFRGKEPTIGTKNISGSGIRRFTKGPTGKSSSELSDPSARTPRTELLPLNSELSLVIGVSFGFTGES